LQRLRSNPRIPLISLAVCMALQMTGYVIILPLFSRRFTELGAGVQTFGASSMAYALAATIAAPFMGALADRIGRRPVVLGSLAVYILAFTGYLYTSGECSSCCGAPPVRSRPASSRPPPALWPILRPTIAAPSGSAS
jgi:MFS family permease